MPGSSNCGATVPQERDRRHSSSGSSNGGTTISHERDRRHSSSSDTSQPDVSHLRQLSLEGIESIPTRPAKVIASKPAANPLQFIKVGPCNLYRSAQEQLKKAEEVKKIKQETRNQEEDWQSNLDNWKSSRRKRQEHIIERVVEVKKLEMEEFDRNRRRSKTFNEMMEERNRTGRKVSLVVYPEDDANDLSDLGIGTSSGKSSVCGDSHDENHSFDERDENDKDFFDNHNGERRNNGLNGHNDNDLSNTASGSSPEPEEYTYERAIQSYVNFTETRVKNKNINFRNSDINDNRDYKDESNRRYSLPNGSGKKPPPPVIPRRDSSSKIEGRLAEFEQKRLYGSSTDLNNSTNSKKIQLPKVDISKRKELFEKASGSCENISKTNRLSDDFSNAKIVKERLSSIEKNNANNSESKVNNSNHRLSGDFSSVKERLTNLRNSTDNVFEKSDSKSAQRHSVAAFPATQTVHERLIELESNGLQKDEVFHTLCPSKESPVNFEKSTAQHIHETNETSAVHKNVDNFHKNVDNFHKNVDNLNNCIPQHKKSNDIHSLNVSENENSKDETNHSNKRQIHRSLDSLDVSPQIVKIEPFERVQSLEDLELCNGDKNYLPSASSTELLATLSQSGDTDREDSGIHTADVSCSVSQADEPIEDGEINNVPYSHAKGSSSNDMYKLEMEILQQQQDDVFTSPEPTETTNDVVVENCTDASKTVKSVEPSKEEVEVVEKTDDIVSSNNCNNKYSMEIGGGKFGDGCSGDGKTLGNPLLLGETGHSSECSTPMSDDEVKGSNNVKHELVSDESSRLPLGFLDAAVICSTLPCNIVNSDSAETGSFEFNPASFISGASFPAFGLADDEPCSSYDAQASDDSLDFSIDHYEQTKGFGPVDDTESTEFDTCHSSISSCEPPLPAESESVSDALCMQNNDKEKEVTDDKTARRRTVVEVCEKVDVSSPESNVRSPPPTPYINVAASFKNSANSVPCLSKVPVSVQPQDKPLSSMDVAVKEQQIVPNCDLNGMKEESEEDTDRRDSKICESENKADVTPVSSAPKDVLKDTPLDSVNVKSQNNYSLYSSDIMDHHGSEHFVNSNIKEIPPLSLTSDIEVVDDLVFPLGPPTTVEPPKEKPPPPPCDISDEEEPVKETSLKRLDSTKRIKKEIRKKRSDFLGIEGSNDDCYLEPELKVAPPPDMTTFLVEERRSEKQLYRQSICSESDSNLGETTESRDSGVELDRGHPDDIWSSKQTLTSEGPSVEHSRDNSEIYCNASITSEEDEITKREREIIENLEKEEQWQYNNASSTDQNNIGEKLAEKLRQLEQEKLQLEWERTEEENRRLAEEMARQEEMLRLRAKEKELQQQESTVISHEEKSLSNSEEASVEFLRAERERLQKENEELARKRESLLRYEQKPSSQWGSTGSLQQQQHWDPTRMSLQDVSAPETHYKAPIQAPVQSVPLNYRLSLPNLQQEIPPTRSVRRPPPPVPPSKPTRGVSMNMDDRGNGEMRTRSPSVDQISVNNRPQQMSRQTLQALSAVPRSRLISNDTWMQPKKKPENQRTNNYQHWLVQEAEHRRITEQQQRNALSPRKAIPPPPPPHHHHHQQQQQVWNNSSPPRQDKPLPDSIIQTLTQRVQNRVGYDRNNLRQQSFEKSPNRDVNSQTPPPPSHHALMTVAPTPPPVVASQQQPPHPQLLSHSPQQQQLPSQISNTGQSQEKMLSVSGKKKCSHCGEELGRGAAMIIESLRLFFHIDCFKCCVCHVQLGDGLMGTDVRVRNNKLHCHNCYSSDDGVKFSCV